MPAGRRSSRRTKLPAAFFTRWPVTLLVSEDVIRSLFAGHEQDVADRMDPWLPE